MNEMEGKWFRLWYDDKQSMLITMHNNLAADLSAGYNPFGSSIRQQRQAIDAYMFEFDQQMEAIKMMDKQHTEHWCYYDLLKRGVIS